MRKQPSDSGNQVRLTGRLEDLRERWMPDGSLAVIAALIIHRTQLGQPRSSIQEEQPMPLRALGEMANALIKHQGKTVDIEGILRRRYYSRDGEQRWGQVEIWVDECQPVRITSKQSHQE